MSGVVYRYVNRVNGKSYIGQTADMDKRHAEHISAALSGSAFCFHRAIRKYGIDAFDREILYQSDDPTERADAERRYIKEYGSFFIGGSGYNMTLGGEGSGGHVVSEDARERLSEAARMAWKDPSSWVNSTEYRERLSHALRLRWSDPSERKRITRAMSTGARGNRNGAGNLGKRRSEESRRKMSLAARSRWQRQRTQQAEAVA